MELCFHHLQPQGPCRRYGRHYRTRSSFFGNLFFQNPKLFNILVCLSSKRRCFKTGTAHNIIVSIIVIVKLVIINDGDDRALSFPLLSGSPLVSSCGALVIGVGLGNNINRVWIQVRVNGGPIYASTATQLRHRTDYVRPLKKEAWWRFMKVLESSAIYIPILTLINPKEPPKIGVFFITKKDEFRVLELWILEICKR